MPSATTPSSSWPHEQRLSPSRSLHSLPTRVPLFGGKLLIPFGGIYRELDLEESLVEFLLDSVNWDEAARMCLEELRYCW